MRNSKIIISCLLILFASASKAQQIPMYGQYMFNMLNINPAYAGIREVGNINFLSRKQWVNFPGAPTSGSLSYDQRIQGKNAGIGAQLYYDQIGIEKSTGVQGFYSYSAPFKSATLNLGMSLGMLNYRTDYSRTNPFDAGDPSLQNNINGYIPTAGFGAILESEKWYLGFSAPALFKTKISAAGQSSFEAAGKETHFFLTGGYIIPLDDNFTLKPSALVKTVSGARIQYDFNLNIWMDDIIGFGASYRTQDAVVAMFELQLNPQIRMGYGYEHNHSKLVEFNRGSHELMIRYELGRQEGKKIQSPRYF